jgi:hypothetical protein
MNELTSSFYDSPSHLSVGFFKDRKREAVVINFTHAK